MLCQKCQKKNATVKIVKNHNGNITEEYLCKDCAGTVDLKFKDFSADGIFDNFFSLLSPAPGGNPHCKGCDTTFLEFKKTGKLGCVHCFETFSPYLDKTLKNYHGASVHTGKIPKRSGEGIKIKKEMDSLKAELQKAVYEERYEDAAGLRDKIRELEGQE